MIMIMILSIVIKSVVVMIIDALIIDNWKIYDNDVSNTMAEYYGTIRKMMINNNDNDKDKVWYQWYK